MIRRSITPFGLALAASLAAACSSGGGDPGAPDQSDESEAEIRASCTNPRRYYVVSRNGPCTTIAGEHGSWVPENDPAFSDAPREVDSTMCIVRWMPIARALPDKKALDDAMGYGSGVAPACGSGASPDVGEVLEAPPPNVILGGSVGCDVCGILHDGHIWVVMPPFKAPGRSFSVGLTNGETKNFQIQQAASPALSIELPALPAGVKYKNGVVKIL
jgi:hypothetical protein